MILHYPLISSKWWKLFLFDSMFLRSIWQEIVTYTCLHLIILISLIQKLNYTMSNRLKDQAVFQQLAHVLRVWIYFQAARFCVMGIARSFVSFWKSNREYLLPRLSKDNEYKLHKPLFGRSKTLFLQHVFLHFYTWLRTSE